MSVIPCLSQSTVSADGKWEGWCWYPDLPQERAVVELFVGSRSIRGVRAARLRTDVRDLGMGDGYCGFQLPLPSKEQLTECSTVEIRERRFGRVIGRVVLGEDGSQQERELRLTQVESTLRVADGALQALTAKLLARAAPMEELGATLSHFRPTAAATTGATHMGTLAVCHDRMSTVPSTELGWCNRPCVSLVVRTNRSSFSGDVAALAGVLREVAGTMRPIGVEFILLDDGTDPLTRFLPSRLRELRLVQSVPGDPPGIGLNAAASTARGIWLAFAEAGTIGTAGLLEAVRDATLGTFYVDTPTTGQRATKQYHRLQSLVTRDAFQAMGGFDPRMDETGIWTDLSDRALLVDQQIVQWTALRDGGLQPDRLAGHCNG